MSGTNGRVDLSTLKVQLPSQVVPIAERPVPENEFVGGSGVFVPKAVAEAKKREPLTTFSCRLRVSTYEELKRKAKALDIDMSAIVVELIEKHVPMIPDHK